MSKYYNNSDFSGRNVPKVKPKRNGWITTLKVCAWCIGALIVLCGIALWIVTYHFSPDRICRIIEEKSGEYLNAELKIGKLDYKIFSTYPWLYFEADSLSVVSKSLDGISQTEREQLPENSDFLASVESLHGKVNIHSLLHGTINLKDIVIEQPRVNIVMVNDSVTNYNIAKTLPKIKKVPEIKVAEMKMEAPVQLSFFSLEAETEAAVNMESFYLARGADDFYSIGFEGDVNGRWKDYSLPQKLPLRFNTDIRPDINNFEARLNNLSFALAGLAFNANGDIRASKTGIDFEKADFDIKIEDIFSLLRYLPVRLLDMIPLPEGLEGNLPIDAAVSLLSPFKVSPDSLMSITPKILPPMTASLKIEDARLLYTPPKGKPVEADDIYLEATADFNMQELADNFIEIKELRMHGEGIAIDANLNITNLIDSTQNLAGAVRFNTPLMQSLSYLMPGMGIKISGLLKGDVEVTATADNYGKSGVKDIRLAGGFESRNLTVLPDRSASVDLRNMRGKYDARIPSYPLTDYSGTRLDFDFQADSLIANNAGMKVKLGAVEMKIDAMDTVSGNPDPNGDVIIRLGGLDFDYSGTKFTANNICLNVSGSLTPNPATNYTTVAATSGGDDALIASRVDHTPLVLSYSGGGIMSTVLNMATISADMTMGNGVFRSPFYLYPVDLTGISLTTDLNDIKISSKNIRLARSAFEMSADIKGLQPFLTSYSATPLKADADINFTNVDINQLSWGYYGALLKQGIPRDSVFYAPPMTPFTAADSVCVAIPRNITAYIRLKSKAAEYMQYTFSPLSTDIIVKDGSATLKQLTVGTPYCTAIVDWTYSTTKLDDIFMDLSAKVKDFNFEHFYKVFPDMIEKSPELRNFTGLINADIGCRFEMFPDMFMNSESLQGRFDIRGTDLEFARQGKIERITHLMLIEGDTPIQIQNINISGSFHDNLLQLNPFKISFDNYQLSLAGVNNTSGDMYYHLALEKSPFHLPFGVSLTGSFKHPEVRLGGTHIDDYKSEMVGMKPDTKLDVNIMAWLHHGWLLFVQEAAKFGEE